MVDLNSPRTKLICIKYNYTEDELILPNYSQFEQQFSSLQPEDIQNLYEKSQQILKDKIAFIQKEKEKLYKQTVFQPIQSIEVDTKNVSTFQQTKNKSTCKQLDLNVQSPKKLFNMSKKSTSPYISRSKSPCRSRSPTKLKQLSQAFDFSLEEKINRKKHSQQIKQLQKENLTKIQQEKLEKDQQILEKFYSDRKREKLNYMLSKVQVNKKNKDQYLQIQKINIANIQKEKDEKIKQKIERDQKKTLLIQQQKLAQLSIRCSSQAKHKNLALKNLEKSFEVRSKKKACLLSRLDQSESKYENQIYRKQFPLEELEKKKKLYQERLENARKLEQEKKEELQNNINYKLQRAEEFIRKKNLLKADTMSQQRYSIY